MIVSKIEWNESFNTNVVRIDDQHKKLVDIYNNFVEAYLNNSTNEILKDLFIDILQYTRYHFKKEEEIMKLVEYPFLSAHIKLHRELIESVYSFLERFEKGNADITDDLIVFLRNWLIHHIFEEDKTISQFADNK